MPATDTQKTATTGGMSTSRVLDRADERLGYTHLWRKRRLGAYHRTNGLLALRSCSHSYNMLACFPTRLTTPLFPGAGASGLSATRNSLTSVCSRISKVSDTLPDGIRRRRCRNRDSRSVCGVFLDHDKRSYELIARVFDGQSEAHARRHPGQYHILADEHALLAPVSIGRTNGISTPKRLHPVAVSVFPRTLSSPRSWQSRCIQTDPFQQGGESGHLRPGNSRNSFRRGSRGLDRCAM